MKIITLIFKALCVTAYLILYFKFKNNDTATMFKVILVWAFILIHVMEHLYKKGFFNIEKIKEAYYNLLAYLTNLTKPPE